MTSTKPTNKPLLFESTAHLAEPSVPDRQLLLVAVETAVTDDWTFQVAACFEMQRLRPVGSINQQPPHMHPMLEC